MFSKLLFRYLSVLCLIFSFFQSFGMEGVEQNIEVQTYQSIKLQKDFACEDGILKDDIINYISQEEHLRLISSDTANLVRVNLYAYNENNKNWYFFSDKNIYVSAWMKQPKNQDNSQYYSTHDKNIKEGFNNIYLGSTYGYTLSNTARDYKKTLTIPPEKEDEVISDFKKRNCNPSKPFNLQTYPHSEQSFLSYLDDFLLKHPREINTGSFKNMVLVFSSTNDACPICLNTLHHMILQNDFRGKILKYFLLADTQPRLIEDNETHILGEHFNIFYSYLDKTQNPPFRFDKKFYTFPVKKIQEEAKLEDSDESDDESGEQKQIKQKKTKQIQKQKSELQQKKSGKQ